MTGFEGRWIMTSSTGTIATLQSTLATTVATRLSAVGVSKTSK